MKYLKNTIIIVFVIILSASLTKPTDNACLNKTISELIERTKSGNSTKDTVIAIIIQGNIQKRLGTENHFLYKKIFYKSFTLLQDGSLKPDNTKIALGLFGNVFFQEDGLKEIIRVNGL